MSKRPSPVRPERLPLALAFASLLLASGPDDGRAAELAAAAPEHETQADCQSLRPAPRPKMAFLNFFWHSPEEFECTMLEPRGGPIDSTRKGYYRRRFRRLARHGVDVLGFVFTGFGSRDPDVDGGTPHTVRDGRNLERAIAVAARGELPFFIYYDLVVRTAVRSKLCLVPPPADGKSCRQTWQRPVSEYDLRDPVLFDQLRGDMRRIKDDLILPHLDAYYFLEDERGRPILDSEGLPRPVIALYVARELVANGALKRLVRKVTRDYRADGLGQPAFVLDTIFWNDPLPRRIVKRFGTAATAVTSFFPVNALAAERRSIGSMRGWVPAMGELYADAAAKIATADGLSHLQVWPGIGTMFDNRRMRNAECQPYFFDHTPPMHFHLDDAEDWRAMLAMGFGSTYTAGRDCAPPRGRRPQSLVINYDNEWRESAVTDCVAGGPGGTVEFPFRFGCSLLEVAREEDRWQPLSP